MIMFKKKYFQIIGNGFQSNNKKRKVAEALLIWEIKPTLNIQDGSHCRYLVNNFNNVSSTFLRITIATDWF